jgi:hypothetical protein
MKMNGNPTLVRLLLACAFLPVGAAQDPEALDKLYGTLQPPAYIKHYEADKTGKILLNPYLQVASEDYPALLNPKQSPYNWVIDGEGRVAIIQEAAHPLGRKYDKGFFRPEDKSKRKPGTVENYGHVSALGGSMGRISGELNYDKGTNSFVINNKSGRYSKNNDDRTPEQLANAARLIRSQVDPGTASWGPAMYLLEYAPEEVRTAAMQRPDLQYDDAKTKSRPHLVVLAPAPKSAALGQVMAAAAAPVPAPAPAVKAAPAQVAEAAPAEPAKTKKAKKVKAANNDDPS